VLAAALMLMASGLALAGEAPATTRYMVTEYRLHPGAQQAWEKYVDSAIPALRKAGIGSLQVSSVLFGPRPAYIHIRPLDKFGELDGPGPFERAGLTEKQIASMNAARDKLLISEDRYIATVVPDLVVPSAAGSWTIRVVQFFRPNPGQGDALRALIRSDVLPAWRQAQQAGRLAGAGVGNTGQGRPGLVVVWTDYRNLAALDGGNPLQLTMGAAPFALFQSRLAQLGAIEDSTIMRRVDALSYSTPN
jgi:hypothetical protein